MSELTEYNGSIDNAVNVTTLSRSNGQVSEKHDGITLNVEGETGDVTIMFKPLGFTISRDPTATAENVIAQNNGMRLNHLGPIDEVIITPTNTGAEYKLTWSFF